MANPKAKSRSGTSRTHAERVEAGQPNKLFSLRVEIDEMIGELATVLGLSRSLVVSRAVERLYAATKRKEP